MNTTCLAYQQIQGADHFSDKNIEALIKFDTTQVEPCLVAFHLARVHIKRLPFTLEQHGESQKHINFAFKVQKVFDTIWLFKLEPWIKENFADKKEEKRDHARAMARIYAVVIRLYGIPALPQSPIIAWAAAFTDIQNIYPIIPGVTIHESLCVHHREELLRMLRRQ